MTSLVETDCLLLLDQGWLHPSETPFNPNFAQLSPDFVNQLGISPDKFVPGLISAIAILVVGFIVAFIAAALTKGLLKRTGLEQKLAGSLQGQAQGAAPIPLGDWIAGLVFWLIIVFTVVAALQSLQLTAVSEPLKEFLNRITGYLPPLGGALLLLAIAWVLATVVKLIVSRSLQAFRLDERLGQLSGTSTESQVSMSETLGNVLFAVIFLFFLPPILNALGLTEAAQPILGLLSQGLTVLLNAVGAAVIAFAGWLVARFVGRLVTNLLSAAGADRLGQQFGFNAATNRQSLSQMAGTVVYVLILIPTAIAALQALKIEAISTPAIAMLEQVLGALPKIFTAVVIVGIAFVAGRFVGQLATNLLSGIGFDNIFDLLGLPAQRTTPAEGELAATKRSPSEIAGFVVLGGIVLFGVVTATEVLGLPTLTAIVQSLLQIVGQILIAMAIFAVGLYLANLAFNLVASSGSGQALILAHTARISIIAFIAAMALQQVGVATDIVKLAFGLLLGAVAVAIAIAFGLGGREIAAEQVREWITSFKHYQPPTPPEAGEDSTGMSSAVVESTVVEATPRLATDSPPGDVWSAEDTEEPKE